MNATENDAAHAFNQGYNEKQRSGKIVLLTKKEFVVHKTDDQIIEMFFLAIRSAQTK